MKSTDTTQENSPGRRRYSLISPALIIISTAVAFGSVFLLVNYIQRIAEDQALLEKQFQAELSEQSALSALEIGFRTGIISDLSDIPAYETGEMRTYFELLNTSTVPPEEMVFRFEDSDELYAVTSGHYVYALQESRGGLRVNIINALMRSDPTQLEPIDGWDPEMYSAAGFLFEGDPMLFLLSRTDGTDSVFLVSPETGTHEYSVELPLWNNTSLVSAGSYRNRPALLISDGSNMAHLFLPDSGLVTAIVSPSGTTPTFYGHGSIYGETGSITFDETPVLTVRDVIHMDWDKNGIDDLVFAGDSSLTCFSVTTGEIVQDVLPGGHLAAWGIAQSENTLSGRWILENGSERWRVLTDTGFTDMSAPALMELDWNGRISVLRRTMMGSVGSSMEIASIVPEHSRTLCTFEDIQLCHLDGAGTDVVCIDGDTLRIVMNPLGGDGLLLTLSTVTKEDDLFLRENTWNMFLHGHGENIRVRSERVI